MDVKLRYDHYREFFASSSTETKASWLAFFGEIKVMVFPALLSVMILSSLPGKDRANSAFSVTFSAPD
jgi:hypothetical protein